MKKATTSNIDKVLQKFALLNGISVKECDFNLNKVETFMLNTFLDDFESYDEDIHGYYIDHEKMINEHVELSQVYTITAKKLTNKRIDLDYTISYDDFSVHPKIIISPDSHIPYKQHKASEILLLLVKEVNKIKARHNILVKIFDENMIKNLKAFTKHIYSGKFKKKVKISLCDGIDPIIARKNKLIMWYKEKDQQNRVIEVKPGEKIIEYRKAKFGKNGLSAFGKIIEGGVSDNSFVVKAHIDKDSVEVVENDDKVLYKSKLKGFVHFQNNFLKVDNTLQMSKLSRLESVVNKDEDNNIEVRVSQLDTDTDSIGEGVHLQSEIIHVTGHVGAKSILEALNLQIDGATHKSSLQYAKDAVINRHKGTLRSNTAKIKLLEGGEVHASKVDVEVALGGHIYAEDVTITQVKSYVKVYASNSIKIHLVSGEDNIFKINYKDVPIMTNKMKFLNDEIKDLKEKLEAADKNAHTQIPFLKQKIKDIRAKQDIIRQTTEHAKISIEKPLRGLNSVIFTLDSGEEIVYKTDPRLYKPFYVEINNENLTLHPVQKTIKIKS